MSSKEWIPPKDDEKIQINLESIKSNIQEASEKFLFGSLSDREIIKIDFLISADSKTGEFK